VALRLSPAARKQLRTAKRVRLKLTAVLTDTAGHRSTVRKTVTLQAPRR
jgi:hypothetical protein